MIATRLSTHSVIPDMCKDKKPTAQSGKERLPPVRKETGRKNRLMILAMRMTTVPKDKPADDSSYEKGYPNCGQSNNHAVVMLPATKKHG